MPERSVDELARECALIYDAGRAQPETKRRMWRKARLAVWRTCVVAARSIGKTDEETLALARKMRVHAATSPGADAKTREE